MSVGNRFAGFDDVGLKSARRSVNNSGYAFPKTLRHRRKWKLRRGRYGNICLPMRRAGCVAVSVQLARFQSPTWSRGRTGRVEKVGHGGEEGEVFGKISQKCRKSQQRPRNICATSNRGQCRIAHSSPSFDARGRPRSWELMGVQWVLGPSQICPLHHRPSTRRGSFPVASSRTARWAGDWVTAWPRIPARNRR